MWSLLESKLQTMNLPGKATKVLNCKQGHPQPLDLKALHELYLNGALNVTAEAPSTPTIGAGFTPAAGLPQIPSGEAAPAAPRPTTPTNGTTGWTPDGINK